MSKILSTDVSNYCRKESGDVKIFEDEWEKRAKALDVFVEDVKEEKWAQVQYNENSTLNEDSSINYNQFCNVPNYLLENQ